jgi:hypothetical protein
MKKMEPELHQEMRCIRYSCSFQETSYFTVLRRKTLTQAFFVFNKKGPIKTFQFFTNLFTHASHDTGPLADSLGHSEKPNLRSGSVCNECTMLEDLAEHVLIYAIEVFS